MTRCARWPPGRGRATANLPAREGGLTEKSARPTFRRSVARVPHLRRGRRLGRGRGDADGSDGFVHCGRETGESGGNGETNGTRKKKKKKKTRPVVWQNQTTAPRPATASPPFCMVLCGILPLRLYTPPPRKRGKKGGHAPPHTAPHAPPPPAHALPGPPLRKHHPHPPRPPHLPAPGVQRQLAHNARGAEKRGGGERGKGAEGGEGEIKRAKGGGEGQHEGEGDGGPRFFLVFCVVVGISACHSILAQEGGRGARVKRGEGTRGQANRLPHTPPPLPLKLGPPSLPPLTLSSRHRERVEDALGRLLLALEPALVADGGVAHVQRAARHSGDDQVVAAALVAVGGAGQDVVLVVEL